MNHLHTKTKLACRSATDLSIRVFCSQLDAQKGRNSSKSQKTQILRQIDTRHLVLVGGDSVKQFFHLVAFASLELALLGSVLPTGQTEQVEVGLNSITDLLFRDSPPPSVLAKQGGG